MAATDALINPIQGANFSMPVGPIFDTAGNVVTGWTSADSEISIDGANFADCTNEAAEIQTRGCGNLLLTAAELTACNYFWVILSVSNSNAVPNYYYGTTSRSGNYLQVDVYNIKTQALVASGTITFPAGTLASTTNITAGTVANLTNAPTNGDFTATMKTSLNAATPSVTVSNKTGFSLADGSIAAATFAIAPGSSGGLLVVGSNASTTFSGSGLVLSAMSIGGVGNISQTGDSFARIGLAGVALTNLGDTRIANLDATVSSRLPTSGYTTPPSASTISTQVSSDLAIAHGVGTWTTATGFATSAQAVKLLAATYDSASLSGSTLTLSNAATQTVTSTGRVTT